MRIRVLLLLSFLEGGAVMSAELLGAKMMAPFFGSSIYVWASVLGVTLGGLAAGYFAGGRLAEKSAVEKKLYSILLLSSVFLLLLPEVAGVFLLYMDRLPFPFSTLAAAMIFLFPPVMLMGAVSPLIIQCISRSGAGSPGKIAGTVYAVSTVGGILATFSLGFYFIPEFGLTGPSIGMGILLGVLPFFMLIRNKHYLSLLYPLTIGWMTIKSSGVKSAESVQPLYASEGLLGQILVVDYPIYEGDIKTTGYQRTLYVNRSTQTVVTVTDTGPTYFGYVHRIIEQAAEFPPASRVLVLGLGGGSLTSCLDQQGWKVEAVELDPRMVHVSKQFFGMSDNVKVHLDDARHYVRSLTGSSKLFDMIVLDAFSGEVNPHHLFTEEFFNQLRPLLKDTSCFFLNANGYWSGKAGEGTRAIARTLLEAGFNSEVFATDMIPDQRNLLFQCSLSDKKGQWKSVGEFAEKDLEGVEVLTDTKPRLEILNAEANRRWRVACLHYFIQSNRVGLESFLFR